MNRLLAPLAAIAWTLTGCTFNVAPFGGIEPLEESVLLGEAGPKLVMLELEGTLVEGSRSTPLGTRIPGIVAEVREALDLAAEDDEVRGLLLRINSPGGTVSASETLHHEILRWQEETGHPVVAYFQGLATSGGYYVAMSAEEVISHPTTVTGSIGVIMLNLNLSGLMEKLGVSDQTFTGGERKDAGSPFREMLPEERAQLQSVVDDLHARFKDVVAQGRPALGREAVERLADGRIFSAAQALDAGLVDAVGYLEDAVESLESRLEIEESRVVTYHRPAEYRNNVYGMPLIDVDLFPLAGLSAPGFYYIWPPALAARR
jgi:protease-4